MAQLSELRSRVRNNVGGRTEKNAIIDTILNNVVNDLGRKYRFNDLMHTDSTLTLAIAAYSVTIPATVRLIESIALVTGSTTYFPKIRDRATIRDIYSEIVPSLSGAAADCYIAGRKIYFAKKADVLYTVYLDCWIYPVTMTSESDTPSIFGIDELIVALATSRLYMHLKQPQAATEWFNLAQTIAQGSLDEVIGPSVEHIEPS